MYIPKRYGESKVSSCPFCGKQSTTTNAQGVLVCRDHKETKMPDMKCLCGSWLDLQTGKWGPYFRCIKCGPVSMQKILSMQPIPKPEPSSATKNAVQKTTNKEGRKEVTVRSDQLDALYGG